MGAKMPFSHQSIRLEKLGEKSGDVDSSGKEHKLLNRKPENNSSEELDRWKKEDWGDYHDYLLF